jgi:hypothetical protein
MTRKAHADSTEYRCAGCFQYVALAHCRFVHVNDGGPAMLGHWREKDLCGPVLPADLFDNCEDDF